MVGLCLSEAGAGTAGAGAGTAQPPGTTNKPTTDEEADALAFLGLFVRNPARPRMAVLWDARPTGTVKP